MILPFRCTKHLSGGLNWFLILEAMIFLAFELFLCNVLMLNFKLLTSLPKAFWYSFRKRMLKNSIANITFKFKCPFTPMLNFELQIQQLIFFFISWIAFICYEISIANTTFRCFDLFTSALLNSEFQIQQFFFLSWTAFFENDVTNKHLNEYEKIFKSFLSLMSFLNS